MLCFSLLASSIICVLVIWWELLIEMGQLKEKGDNCQKADSSLQHYYSKLLIYWTIDVMEFLAVLHVSYQEFMTNKTISEQDMAEKLNLKTCLCSLRGRQYMFYLTGIFLGVLSVTRLRATSASDWAVYCMAFLVTWIYTTALIETGSFFMAVKVHQFLLLI